MELTPGGIEPFRIAAGAMAANPARTLLSTLGVVVGVAALVSILALSDGLERFSREQIANTTDLQMITVRPVTTETVDGVRIRRREPVRLEPTDASELARVLGDRADVALAIRRSEWVRPAGDTVQSAVVVSFTTPEARGLLPAPLSAGRFIERRDSLSHVAVVSAGLGERLVRTGGPLGSRIETPMGSLEVIGVISSDSMSPAEHVVVPFALADSGDATASIRVRHVEDVERARLIVERWAVERFGGSEQAGADGVTVTSNEARANQARRAMLVFKMIMGAIAGISLVVGGIGIMNVLLASVSERTREIGIRKATGARSGDIRFQFMAESLAISGLGSLLGLGLGIGVAMLVAAVARRLTEAPVEAAFTWPSLMLATGAALLVGLIFGTWPARRASRLSPIEALHDE